MRRAICHETTDTIPENSFIDFVINGVLFRQTVCKESLVGLRLSSLGV